MTGTALPDVRRGAPLIVITANSFTDGVERRRFSGSHHRHGSSRRQRLAVITSVLPPRERGECTRSVRKREPVGPDE